ncbi:hypothetical protein ACFL0Y_03530 [Patescibacteria group bacterium]
MFRYSFDKRPVVENSQRVSVSVMVRNSFLEFKKAASEEKKKKFDLKNEDFVKDLIEMIESGSTLNLKQESNGEVEFTKPNKIKLAYTKSNLGKGFVFWFICQVCGRKVRYLYFPPNSQTCACRICHRLAYKQQNENKRFRNLSRFLR